MLLLNFRCHMSFRELCLCICLLMSSFLSKLLPQWSYHCNNQGNFLENSLHRSALLKHSLKTRNDFRVPDGKGAFIFT